MPQGCQKSLKNGLLNEVRIFDLIESKLLFNQADPFVCPYKGESMIHERYSTNSLFICEGKIFSSTFNKKQTESGYRNHMLLNKLPLGSIMFNYVVRNGSGNNIKNQHYYRSYYEIMNKPVLKHGRDEQKRLKDSFRKTRTKNNSVKSCKPEMSLIT